MAHCIYKYGPFCIYAGPLYYGGYDDVETATRDAETLAQTVSGRIVVASWPQGRDIIIVREG